MIHFPRQSKGRPQTPCRSFTMLELMVTIAIIAALIVVSLFFVVGVVSWTQSTMDQHTYTVLNDALGRYKTEGGGVSGLTAGASVNRVLSQMQTAVTWGGMGHQFLETGITYHGGLIGATGTGAQYHFSRYNTYSDGSGQGNSTSGGSWPAFVAINYVSGANSAYSSDGIHWLAGGALPPQPNWQAIAYGNGKFVAISTIPSASAYSTDGINWTAGNTMPSNYFQCIAYGNGKFVAVSSTSGTATAYSTDGINWTAGNPMPAAASWSMAYGNGMFVAVYGKTLAYIVFPLDI